MNKVCIIGTLTRDPETRFTTSGAGICTVSIAYNKHYTQNGEKKEKVSYFECEAWNKTGELIQSHFHKGHKIGITGELSQDRWDDTDGKKHSKVKIIIENIDFLQGKRDKDGEYKEPEKTESQPSNSFPDNPFSDDSIPF